MHNQGFPQAFSVGYFSRDKMGYNGSGLSYHKAILIQNVGQRILLNETLSLKMLK